MALKKTTDESNCQMVGLSWHMARLWCSSSLPCYSIRVWPCWVVVTGPLRESETRVECQQPHAMELCQGFGRSNRTNIICGVCVYFTMVP